MNFIFSIFIIMGVSAQTLTLHVIKSPKGFDWSTPRSLVFSAIQNKLAFSDHFMGHLYVEKECFGEKNFSGMSTKKLNFFELLFWEQTGLGIFYHSFEGKKETSEEILKDLKSYSSNERYEKIQFKISQSQCERLNRYEKEFDQYKIYEHYGLAHRPLMAEGSGCSAYAMSFLDVLNQISFEMKNAFQVNLLIPQELIGKPLKDQKVSLVKIIQTEKWANDNVPHEKLSFWDPDKIYDWIKKQKKEKNLNSLMIDISHIPAPEESIWRQHLDPQYQLKTKR